MQTTVYNICTICLKWESQCHLWATTSCSLTFIKTLSLNTSAKVSKEASYHPYHLPLLPFPTPPLPHPTLPSLIQLPFDHVRGDKIWIDRNFRLLHLFCWSSMSFPLFLYLLFQSLYLHLFLLSKYVRWYMSNWYILICVCVCVYRRHERIPQYGRSVNAALHQGPPCRRVLRGHSSVEAQCDWSGTVVRSDSTF